MVGGWPITASHSLHGCVGKGGVKALRASTVLRCALAGLRRPESETERARARGAPGARNLVGGNRPRPEPSPRGAPPSPDVNARGRPGPERGSYSSYAASPCYALATHPRPSPAACGVVR